MSVPDQPPRPTPESGAVPEEHYSDPVLLEADEDVAPRPEEDVADLLRADPAD